jgi:XRE family aerobic/anaerobic benzoate catabolism transcriptional regulator
LSERSGVSPRYIAQLEGGAGNVSIALLYKIAAALDYKIESMLHDTPSVPFPVNHGNETGDCAALRNEVLQQLQTADTATLERVKQLLHNRVADRAQRICLIGLRGAGKSTLGKMAGDALQIPFVELNSEIERIAGMPVAEIIALYGTGGYRELESRAVREVVDQHQRVILAVAGGVVGSAETYQLVLDRFSCVWLKASPLEHMERVVAQGDTRPMAGNPAAMQHLKNLLSDREKEYCKAQAMVDTEGQTAEHSLRQLLETVKMELQISGLS